MWFCVCWRTAWTHRHILTYMYIQTHSRQTHWVTAQSEGQPHDTPGKGELAVTNGRVQISRVNINVQLGLCSPLFFSTSPHDGFFMRCSVLPSFPQLWYDYKQIRIYVIIFACGWFLWCRVFFFLYVKINSCGAWMEQRTYTASSYLWL